MSLSFLNIENILVFEDSQEDQFIIKRKLDQAGLRAALHFCNDKVSFLHQIAKNIPDIILSDYHIPGIHGYEILELCKARFPNVPFIFVTGKITEDIVDTLQIARNKFPGSNSSLDALCKRFGEKSIGLV